MPRRRLTEEDRELWRRVAKSARPLMPGRDGAEPGKPPKAATASAPPAATMPPPSAPVVIPPMAMTPAKPAKPPRPSLTRMDLAPGIADRLAQEPVRMEKGLHRAMTRGKLEPDARIDLHGMTVAQAHHALLGFVMAAHARGNRLLLVITGKGRRIPRDDHAPMPARAGILKHEVPIWLRQAPLGPLVLELREAHRSQGGTGAYYVYLRKRGR